MNYQRKTDRDSLVEIGTLIGDPVRIKIFWSLLDGRAYTATELALAAETSPQNMSMHLGKLIKAGLLAVEVQGRHRYYTIARPEVAYAVEGIALLAPSVQVRQSPEPDIRFCRTCYDHLAGKVGVLITESLVQQQLIRRKELSFELSTKGQRWFTQQGIDWAPLQQQRRAFARVCLDWTERKPHLAGSLGAALLKMMREEHWIRPKANSRAVVVTAKGEKALYQLLKVEVRADT